MIFQTRGISKFVLCAVILLTALPAWPQDRTTEDKKQQADAIQAEAFSLYTQGTVEAYRAALAKFREAIRLYREINSKDERFGISMLVSGLISNRLGDKPQALSFYESALSFFRTNNYPSWEALTLSNLGSVYDSLGEKQKALAYFGRALLLFRKMGDSSSEATALNNIGSVHLSLGENQKALEYYSQALTLFKQNGDKSGEAATLNNIGSAYLSLGESHRALEHYNQALPMARQVGDISGEATTLNNIGKVYHDLGDAQKALEYYEQALPLRKEVGDKSGEATTLNNIGRVYDSLGEDQKALEYYNQALPLRRQVGDRSGEATTLNNIGAVYDDLGERQKALEYYDQSLPLRRQVGDKSGEAMTLNNIGAVYSALGENQKALEYYSQALLLRRQVGDKSGEAMTLNNIGTVYSGLGERQKALEYYALALPLRRQVGDKSGEAATLNNIGEVYSGLGEKQKALEYYTQALPLLRQVGDKSGEATLLGNVTVVVSDLQNSRLAVFFGKQSINQYQELRQAIQKLDRENQQTYLRSIQQSYRYLAELLIADDRLAEALQVLNSFKDQQFFDFNQDRIKLPEPLELTPREKDLSERYEESISKLVTVRSRLEEHKRQIGDRAPTKQETVQLEKLERDLRTTTDSFRGVLKQADAEFSKPADEKDKVGDVPDLGEMQTALRSLNQQTGQRTVAVYQLVGKDNFSAVLITSDRIEKVSIRAKAGDLDESAQKLWGLLQSDRYDTTVLSKKVYDIVFKPLETKLPKDTTTIMWALDSNLRYLPMAALWDGKRFLAERYDHVVFTRADADRMTRSVSAVWTGTGFGSSRAAKVDVLGTKISFSSLPGVSEELSAVFRNPRGGIIEGTTFPDAEFSRDRFLRALKEKRPLVHIASHFSFRPGDEARSFLLMGDGTAFTLEEMKRETNLFQGVELLTLSACNTAAIQSGANGREIDGFAELAQRLGAGAVMATLWQVSDASTPWLMREFYAKRQGKKGMTKTEALRQAQLALLNGTAQTKPLPNAEKGSSKQVEIVILPKGAKRDHRQTRSDAIYIDSEDAPLYRRKGKPKFAHPYYWAPFILIGNLK